MRLREIRPKNSRRRHTKTLDQSALLELGEPLRSADGETLMATVLTTMLQALIDAGASARIGVAPHERTDTRTGAAR